MFSSYPTFFVKDAQQQRGIHCRFGMPSIIAESHYDGGRNFIAMVRGKKRYILNHPNQCTKLHMMKTGMSARHSEIDWSDPNNFELFGDATGLEVVLEAGDVLFLPALWFHYIVSLEVNIQCNTRSGTPATYSDDIRKCGFSVFVTEGGKQGRLTPLEAENLKTEAPPVLRGSAGESVSGDLQFMVQDAVDSTPVAAGVWVVLVVLLVSSVIVFGVYLRRRLVSQPFQVNNHAKLGPSGRR
jgi:Cupin-like domain